MKRPLLLLIDCHALLHRAFHAVPPSLKTKNGEPTNAVFGFTSSLLSAIETLQPTYIIAAFDPPGKTFRHDVYADYKATRAKTPDDLRSQLILAREVIDALGIPRYETAGFEADDVIGTVIHQLADQDVEVIIATGDKDALQLLAPHVRVWTLRQGIKDTILYDLHMLKDERSLTPAGFRMAKALRGDPSDNIPGVAGVGEKSANIVAAHFETPKALAAALANQSEAELKALGLSSGLQTKLREAGSVIDESYYLVTIRTDAPIVVELAKSAFQPKVTSEVETLFQDLEFSTLMKRLRALAPETADAAAHRHKLPRQYELVSEKAWPALKQALASVKLLAVDTETDALDPLHQQLVGCSLSWRAGHGYYLPFGHDEGDNLPPVILTELVLLLNRPDVVKIGHNIKFDLHTFANASCPLKPAYFDTMIAAHLLWPDKANRSLDECSFVEFGEELQPISSLIGRSAGRSTMAEAPISEVAPYAAEDADFTFRLYERFSQGLQEQKLWTMMTEQEMPVLATLFAMERRGICVDKAVLNQQAKKLMVEQEAVAADIRAELGEDLNVNSADQLAAALFQKLELPDAGLRRKGKRASTAAAELEKIRHLHPVVPFILAYREKAKLVSTYLLSLPELIDERDGRLHTTYSQTTASTGRLASLKPNLQNIPIRTEAGRAIRTAFVAAPGKQLLSADYSQIELRIVAHASADSAMMAVFQEGRDLHTATAAEIFATDLAKVTPEQRRIAKAINFSLMFGISAFGLSEYIGRPPAEAAQFIDRYFTVYAGVKKYMEQIIAQAKERGYAETLGGYRLPIPDLQSAHGIRRAAAERLALNVPIQGTEAEILKRAMIALADLSATELLLTVHDELVFEVDLAKLPVVVPQIRQAMEQTTQLSVPIVAEFKVGHDWGDMTPYQEKM